MSPQTPQTAETQAPAVEPEVLSPEEYRRKFNEIPPQEPFTLHIEKAPVVPLLIGASAGLVFGSATGLVIGFVGGPVGMLVGISMGALIGLGAGGTLGVALWTSIPQPYRSVIAAASLLLLAEWTARQLFSWSLWQFLYKLTTLSLS